MKRVNIIGAIIGFIALGLTAYWYDWRLMLILVLALWGNNLERRGR